MLIQLGYTVVYLDEYSIDPSKVRPYTWSMKGEDNFVYSLPRMRSTHMIVATTFSKIIHWRSQETGFKAADNLVEDLRQIKENLFMLGMQNTQNCIVLLDNAPVHCSNKVNAAF